MVNQNVVLPDGSTFPVYSEELVWRMVHFPDSITRGDMLKAAQMCTIYGYLTETASHSRIKYVISGIRRKSEKPV